MDVGRTMEFILKSQAKAEVEMAAMREQQVRYGEQQARYREQQIRYEAKSRREMDAIRALIRAARKMQEAAEEEVRGLRGGNGQSRKN